MNPVRFARPEILDAIPRDRDAVIEASAGTGKTFTLEMLVMDLLLQGTAIEKILVVTFTEQATAELRARIRERIEALLGSAGDDRDAAPGGFWVIDAEARERLTVALSALDSATISTLHGFCHRTLAELAFDAGRLFGETQVDAEEAFEQAFFEVLRTELSVKPGYREWVELWLERHGKLDGLEELLRKCAAERGELRPRFDPAALAKVAQTLPFESGFEAALLAELAATKMHGGTRKGVVARIEECFLLAQESSPAAPHRLTLLGTWLAKNFDWLDERLGAGPKQREFHAAISALRSSAVPLEAAAVQVLLPPVKSRLQKHKRESGQFDFDDMLSLVRDALHGPRGDEFAQRIRERYAVALVDEFQDTDEVQWDIFKTLFHGQPGCRLYLIGDPKQAIYGFRGADVHTYLAAKNELLAHGGERVPLEKNFRSTQPLIEAVNAILDPAAQPAFFNADIRYENPVTCGKPDLALRDGKGKPAHPVELWHLHARGNLGNGRVLEALGHRIAEEIHDIVRGRGLTLDGRPLGYGDVYVLAQKGVDERRVGRILRARGVPVAFFKQNGLFETSEARDVLDLLRAIAAPADLALRRRAWLTPFFALELDALEHAGEVPAEHPLLARLLGWNALAQVRDYERLFARILDESGLARRELLLAASERELTNYQHLFELLLEEVHRSRSPCEDLAQTLDAYVRGTRAPPGSDPDVQRLESDRRAVKVMTLHKSKGLQAPVVFLFGGFTAPQSRSIATYHDSGRRCVALGTRDPAVSRQVQAEQDEEHRRLLYVGITRAEGRLYLPFVDDLDAADQEALGAGAQSSFSRMDGMYRLLDDRLIALRAEGRLTPAHGFVRRHLRVAAPDEEAPEPPAPLRWNPDPCLLELPPADPRPLELRPAHAGFFVTSYSRMAGARGEEDDVPAKPETSAGWVELAPDQLRPGAETGIFIHALLEAVPLAELAAAREFESWAAMPAVEARVQRLGRRHGIDSRQLPHAKKLVWNAVRTPLALRGGQLEGIASASHVLRELEFLYPIPERHHPLLDRGAGAFSIDRGCIKGFIDLVFEHEGLAYFADWKSDLLGDYAPAALGAHVQAHYAIQEKLYALAMVRQLGIDGESAYEARFGGSLYLFLRGMDGASAEGVHLARPAWKQIVAWEQELLAERHWGISA